MTPSSREIKSPGLTRLRGRSKRRDRDVKKPLTWKKILFRTVFAITAILFIYVAFTFFQVLRAARSNEVTRQTRVDAIVVLGAAQYNGTPSPVLKARLDHALNLFERGVAPVIIVTGGNQEGDITTEATASANYLMSKGVKDSEILREVQGSSTYDSLRDTAAFAKEHDIEKVVIVTDGFHELRSVLTAEELGLDAIGSPAKESPIKGGEEWKQFVSETFRVSLGRVIGFRRVSSDSNLAHLVKK